MIVTPVPIFALNQDVCNCGDVINLLLPCSLVNTAVDETTAEDLDDLLDAADTVATDINVDNMVIVSSSFLYLFFHPIPSLVLSSLLNNPLHFSSISCLVQGLSTANCFDI